MFNDESDQIRFHSIIAITKIALKFPIFISDDNLSSLLLIISHNDPGIQKEAYKMLGHLNFTSNGSVEQILDCLFSKLCRNEFTDENALFKCIANLGLSHAQFFGFIFNFNCPR